MEKRRIITSLQKLPPLLAKDFRKMYKFGYEPDEIVKIESPLKMIYAVPFETEDTFYLIKINNVFKGNQYEVEAYELINLSNSISDADLGDLND